jgi:hypothetical protein
MDDQEPKESPAEQKPSKAKTLGQAIDAIVAALEALPTEARGNALRAAAEHVGIVPPRNAEPRDRLGDLSGLQDEEDTRNAEAPVDIRSLKTAKQPASAYEMACLVAHYLDSLAPVAERQKSIKTADLEKYFKQAGYPLPKRIEQVLIDAKAAGYFDSAGTGSYKLNPVGYNLVVHTLPRKTKAKGK